MNDNKRCVICHKETEDEGLCDDCISEQTEWALDEGLIGGEE